MSQLAPVEDVVLLLDVSGSMTERDYPPSRLEAAKAAALEFLHQKLGIDPRDNVSVVTFAGAANRLCNLLNLDRDRERLENTIKRISCRAWTGTAIGDGLSAAGAVLGESRSPIQRIVLLSDGQNNRGRAPQLLAEQLKKAGVIIDTIGIGDPKVVDEATLKAIASEIDGRLRYRHISSARELIRYFAGLSDKVRAHAFAAVPDAAPEIRFLGPATPRPGARDVSGEDVQITLLDSERRPLEETSQEEAVEIKFMNAEP